MKKLYILLLLLMPLASVAQELSVKTNALYWPTGTMNLGLEVGLGKRVTLEASGAYSPFKLKSDLYLKQWSIYPELRIWLSRKMYGHFFGIGVLYSDYNVSGVRYPGFKDTKHSRYEGNLVAPAISYGYQWPIAKRWNMEASIGVGYAYAKYDKYERGCNGAQVADDAHKWVLIPTRASLSFIYLIR